MKTTSVAVGFLLLSAAAVAQQYTISTVAGGAPPPTPRVALSTSLGSGGVVATDVSGNIYIVALNCVFKLDAGGVLTLVAGNSRVGSSGDGGPATGAQLRIFPFGNRMTVDNAGNLYIVDSGRIRKVSPNGIITTVAGNGTSGSAGDGGPATDAQLGASGVVADNGGNLYIADAGSNRIRKVSPSGIITTVAGNGTAGSTGDGGAALNAQLRLNDGGIAIDNAGNLYVITDSGPAVIRKISSSGIITTVTGTSIAGFSGDGGPAADAQLNNPTAIAVDGSGNLYIADQSNNRIRKVSPSGIITTVAGNGTFGSTGDGAAATGAEVGSPVGIAVDTTGNVFIGGPNGSLSGTVRRISTNGTITTVAGNGLPPYSGDGGPAVRAQLSGPSGIALDSTGNFYIADQNNNRVRKISSSGIITTVAGNGTNGSSGDGGPATSAPVGGPFGVAVDNVGNLYISGNSTIRKVSPNGTITSLPNSFGLAVTVDAAGNLYYASPATSPGQVFKLSLNGSITTVAGNGTSGFSGDGGPAVSAQLNKPTGLAIDAAGNIYVADTLNSRIRKISTSGIITTVAGGGTGGLGDGGPATAATLQQFFSSVAVDSAGNIYIAELSRVRKVSTNGIITTIAGDNSSNYGLDGGLAINAGVDQARGIVVDSGGNVSFAAYDQNTVRLLQPSNTSLSVSSVTNGASNLSGPIAPGEIIVLYGSGLGPAQITEAHVGADGGFGTQLAGTTVSFNGIAAPMIYTSATQVSAVVPYGMSGSSAQVAVSYQGQTTAGFSVPIVSSAPAVFTSDSTGKGQAAALNQDNSLNTGGTPAKVGDVIVLFATGEGQTAPGGVDGKLATVPLPHPNLSVSVTIGGQNALVQYAGGAPGEIAGLMQINAVIPSGIQTGSAVPVAVQVGNVSSQPGVTTAIRGN